MKLRSDLFHKFYNYEYWPSWAFYFPVLLLWPYYAIKGKSLLFFTAANPCIPHGGSFGESKQKILSFINPKYLPETIFIKTENEIESITRFPWVAKPDIGERGDHVALIHSKQELKDYYQRLKRPFILQEYLTSNFEAGVMVYREPKTKKLYITSVAVKEFLKIIGDGKKSLFELVHQSPRARFQWERLKNNFSHEMILPVGSEFILEPIGNHCRGTTFINANELITKDLANALEESIAEMNDFNFGRFDLKADSATDLKSGRTIKIMELNGAFSEPGHIYDPQEKLWRSWRDLIVHWNLLAGICGQNLKQGHRATSFLDFVALYVDYRKLHKKSKV